MSSSALKPLSQQKCQPCEGTSKPLNKEAAAEHLKGLPLWKLSDDAKILSRDFLMKNFMAAIRLINLIAQIAESENHHPNIYLENYRKLTIKLTTHAIGGLSINDFIVASKINDLPMDLKP